MFQIDPYLCKKYCFYISDHNLEQLLSIKNKDKNMQERSTNGPPNIYKVQPSSGKVKTLLW